MSVFWFFVLTVTAAFGNDDCDNLLVLNEGEVGELLNPNYPSKDDPEKNCTWTVVADTGRQIVLVCPFNDGSDTRTDKRIKCGAEMRIWDVGGDVAVHCRDQTFVRVGISNKIFISYENDDDTFYNRTAGFKCYLHAPMKSLWDPIDLGQKSLDAGSTFGNCDFFIELEHYDIIRLALFEYDEDHPWWRKCRWTVVSPQGSQITVTCPFTAKPPDPLLMQVEPCTGEFTVITHAATQDYHCSDKAFSRSSTKNRIILEYMSLIRKYSENMECYVHSKSVKEDSRTDIIKRSLIRDCDHFIELFENTTIKSPDHPRTAKPGSVCRWTVISPVHTRMALNCDLRHLPSSNSPPGEKCSGEFRLTSLGRTETYCQEAGFYFVLFSRNNEMILTYKNPSNVPATAIECLLTLEKEEPTTSCRFCSEYQSCDRIIKLDKREITQVKSAHYPLTEPPGTHCRWTVIAEAGRKIVLVRPFSHKVEPYTRQDSKICNGHFTVRPKGGIMTNHCQNRGFYRIGGNSRMVITYHNTENTPLDNFVLYLYAELKERWDQPGKATRKIKTVSDFERIDFGAFDNKIALGRNSMATLIPPSHLEEENAWSKIRWNVSVPYASRITFACHFTDKPPEPLLIQMVPCWGEFTILTKDAIKSYDCAERAFSYFSYHDWMVLVYENPQNRCADNFVCFAYSEDDSYRANEIGEFRNEKCDHAILLKELEFTKLVQSRYFDGKNEQTHSACRWTLIAPLNYRVVLACIGHSQQGPYNRKELPCHGKIEILPENGEKTSHCSERTFSRTSVTNRMVVTYENEFLQSIEPMLCHAYAEDANYYKNLTEQGKLSHASCGENIHIPAKGKVSIASPSYPNDEPKYSACRWSVEAPADSRILLMCPSPRTLTIGQLTESCPNYILVETKDRPTSIYCYVLPLIRASADNKMVVTFENRSPYDSAESFKCFLYAAEISPENECTNCNDAKKKPYEKCDFNHTLTDATVIDLELPSRDTPDTACRWTLVSPSHTRILISCPNNLVLSTKNKCNSNFKIVKASTEVVFCRSDDFHQYAPNNWTIMTYDNPSSETFSSHFKCYAYVEKTLPTYSCVNCTALEALDYSSCDTTIELTTVGQVDSIRTPKNMKPGIPCRWTVHSPKLTGIFLKCDLDAHEDRSDDPCRGVITVYHTGPAAEYHCRFSTFSTYSIENKMIITYGNQIGASNQPFECSITVQPSACNHTIKVPHLQYNQYYKLSTPYWDDIIPPSCYWSFESEKNTQIYLYCRKTYEKRYDYLLFSPTGHETLANGTLKYLDQSFTEISDSNKMTLLYNMTASTKRNSSIGCRIYVDKAPQLPPKCQCSNKFYKMKPSWTALSELDTADDRGIFTPHELFPRDYPMMSAIYNIKTKYLVCAAVIISDRFALTSADCVNTVIKSSFAYVLAVGLHIVGEDIPYYDINLNLMHENKIPDKAYWDIGIVGVQQKIIFNNNVRPVCMSLTSRSFVNKSVITLGWAVRPFHEVFVLHILPRTMLKMEGYIDTDENCRKNHLNYVPAYHLCVKYKYAVPCKDYLGGPVLWRNPDTGLWKLLGIISIDDQFCSEEKSSVEAMKANYFTSWASHIMQDFDAFCKNE